MQPLNFMQYFEVLLAALALIVWNVRHEGKTNQLERLVNEAQKDIDTLRVKHENLDSKIVEQLTEIKQILAHLQGALGIKIKGEL